MPMLNNNINNSQIMSNKIIITPIIKILKKTDIFYDSNININKTKQINKNRIIIGITIQCF